MRVSAVFVLVVLILALWAVSGRESRTPATAAHAPSSAVHEAPANVVQAPAHDLRRDAAPEPPRAVGREFPAWWAARVRPPHPEGTAVIVALDPRDGLPVSGAEIRILTREDKRALLAEDLALAELEEGELVERRGRSMFADHEGRVLLPEPGTRGALVQAYAGDRFAEGRMNSTWLHLELVPLRVLEIETVDANGEPLGGVPVKVLARSESGASVSWWSGETDASSGYVSTGRLNVRDYHMMGRQTGWRIFAATADPLFGRERELDFERWPGRITFRMPATGVVAIELCHPDGTAFEAEASVSLLPTSLPAQARNEEVHVRQASSEAGRAEFDKLALGFRYDVRVSAPGYRASSVTLSGPIAAGEVVRAQLCLGQPKPKVFSQLVDSQGQLLVDQLVEVSAYGRNARGDTLSAGSHILRSDGNGNVEFVLPNELYDGGNCRLLFSTRPHSVDSPLLSAETVLADEHAFGDVYLGQLSLLPHN